MILVERIAGNEKEPEWRERLADAETDIVRLSQWEAQKNRLRKTTEKGLSLAVSLERGALLRDGDILFWNMNRRHAVICRIDLCDVLIIEPHRLDELSPEQLFRQAVRLGHALGNQHWPAVVRAHRVYVPITTDRDVIRSVMRTHHFENLSYEFAPGAAVLDQLEPAEIRLLFGGGEIPAHHHHADPCHHSSHSHSHETSNRHEAGHHHLHGWGGNSVREQPKRHECPA